MSTTQLTNSTKLFRYAALVGAAIALAVSVTACGGSDSSDPSDSSGSNGSLPSGAPSFGADFEKIQQCLDAAGIKTKLPSGAPSGMPSGAPSGTPPSGAPSFDPGQAPPSGFGDGGQFAKPKVQRALEACGISLPTAP